MNEEQPVPGFEVLIGYRQGAYDESEIACVGELLGDMCRTVLEPMPLALMGGTSEMLVTVRFQRPLLSGSGLHPAVSAGLSAACPILSEWYARLARNRPSEPELIGVRIEGDDFRLEFSNDLSSDAVLTEKELRGLSAAARQIAGRLASLPGECLAARITLGLHSDPTVPGGGCCVVGRYWELGGEDDEPQFILDSWRGHLYARRPL